jgi:hypothetical protein
MNRALISDLAAGRLLSKAEHALFLGTEIVKLAAFASFAGLVLALGPPADGNGY